MIGLFSAIVVLNVQGNTEPDTFQIFLEGNEIKGIEDVQICQNEGSSKAFAMCRFSNEYEALNALKRIKDLKFIGNNLMPYLCSETLTYNEEETRHYCDDPDVLTAPKRWHLRLVPCTESECIQCTGSPDEEQ